MRTVCALLLGGLLAAGTAPARADCACLYKGERRPLGDRICLTLGGKSVTAQCRMNQNITSWVPIDSDCRIASKPAPAVEEPDHAHLAALGPSDH